MNDFSLFGPALIGLIAIGWLSHPLEKASELSLTNGQRWKRRAARLAMFILAMVVLASASQLGSGPSMPEGAEPDIPYSF